MKMKTTVVMRAHNDMPLLEKTLQGLSLQTLRYRLIAFDNASLDGSRGLLDQHAAAVFHVPEGEYIPGRVLNQAMEGSDSEIVVFLNADCEPADRHWLAELIEPFDNPNVGATFSRQLPRPGCHPLSAHDTEAAYGDGSLQAAWRHCFSMASSAIRRSLWQNNHFSETLGYSEDIAWSWQVRQSGYEIRYVPTSRVYHSHNYTNRQWHKRQYGEGKAEAFIFDWSAWQRSMLRYSVLPMARQVLRDIRYCASTGQWQGITATLGYRFSQMTGRRRGLLDGLQEAGKTQ